MNPSSSGWIDKFGYLVKDQVESYKDYIDLYEALKNTGFVYGLNIKFPRFIHPEHKLSEDEKAKINLLAALYYTYRFEKKSTDFNAFLIAVFQFYQDLGLNKISFLNKLFVGSKTSDQLEKLIDTRVYLEDNVISKTFNSIITNSLLYIDVLTFKRYLSDPSAIEEFAENFEKTAMNVIYHTLNSKENHENDHKLAHLFEASLTFIDSETHTFDANYRDRLQKDLSPIEKQYLLDLAALTIWEDHSIDYMESEFIYQFGKDLGFTKNEIATILDDISVFFEKNLKIIPHLKNHNLASKFYDSMSKVVNKLILRNSKRLQKELSESKELVALISKSTVRDLSAEEKKKVQSQLLDIFKSIPSLAIFMLPGGAILLPIFIKLIPKLLPSSFDENRIDKT
ncbi:LETM1-related biofilm-associated protein [Maribacter polysiphoniae]|uniref:LETM1-related biofilm-associated protein n=1 Tax=Maribacter polysiphoniae TaxID=429344 RepID=UPI0023577ED4|nr:LETM1-related biofilm-associated protein [Maribacter polysiphoniae]